MIVIVVHCSQHKDNPEASQTLICANQTVADAWADKYAKAGWQFIWQSGWEQVLNEVPA